jgi:hypothetical protein
VISGDTAPSDNLIELAQGADVLAHEAFYEPAIDRLVANVPNATSLKSSRITPRRKAPAASPRQPASSYWCFHTWSRRTILR